MMRALWKKMAVFVFAFAALSMLQTVYAQSIVTSSGDLSMEQPTKAEIAERWLALEKTTDIYVTEPSYAAPYVLGELTEEYLEDTEDHLNFLRYIAHMPAVEQNRLHNTDAQYASVVTAANKTLSHKPTQPADMDYEFWSHGYAGASSSNLAASWKGDALWYSMQQYMDDYGVSNADALGHRRWLLNPSLLYVGFGQAGDYTATSVFDHSRGPVEYDYIAWPASGNFPSTVFGNTIAWSVCLNSSKYDIPDDSKVKVTLTRASDEKKWVFDTLISGTQSDEYFTINHTRYGDSTDCIIFCPDLGDTEKYEGKYTVCVTGITEWNGTPTTLEYTVNFFDLADYAPALEIIKQPEDVCGFPGKVTVKMEASGHRLKYTWVVIDQDELQIQQYPTNSPEYTCTLNEETNGQQIYCDFTDYSGKYRVSKMITLRLAEITEQPKNVTVRKGAVAKTSVEATGDGLKYAWYYKDAGAKKYTKSSVKSSVYKTTMDSSRNGRRLYCVITDKYGNKMQTKTVLLRMAASIVTQPKDVSAASGKVAKTTVSAVGSGLKYTWYFKDKGASKFSKSSMTGKSYSLTMSSKNNGRQVYCVVKDKYGKTATSKTVTFGLPVKITTEPKTAYAKSGSTAKVTVKASGDGLTYTWYVKSKGKTKYTKSSVTKATYSVTMNSKTKDRLVYCVVKDKYGNKVQSKTVVLRMAASLTAQPKSVTAAKGKTAAVSVKAAGDGLTYTWYIKNAGASKFSKSYVTKPTYSVTMSSKTRGRQVYCVVKDKYGKTVKTNTVTLKMK